uniref:Uncharacterized protein n=1 Tax=Chromera velia CCMP2878 TaxID=1169474 RepID=A0A0K6S5V0_9ALVE|eukprot:Cvel_15026.t1-p1 / transcript=Cvel_15026.t1 / gene=Cvel_15026 / organism=Chromera_velia_CCMP2878 / gene_product=hypothetical protein / transcript_product=hypothetical protein / location=Cvel_scaffold1093:44895-45752(+) / protein_length=208 / sequence_SO=supercontig / SO=protein_coding / is_pseudo=false
MTSVQSAQEEFEHWKSLCRHRFRTPPAHAVKKSTPFDQNPFVLVNKYEEDLDKMFDQISEVLRELNAAETSATFIPKAQMALQLLKSVMDLESLFGDTDGRFKELMAVHNEVVEAIRSRAKRYADTRHFWAFLIPEEREMFRHRHLELFQRPLPSLPAEDSHDTSGPILRGTRDGDDNHREGEKKWREETKTRAQPNRGDARPSSLLA